MNIKEAIEYINKVGKAGIELETAKQFWDLEQGKSLSDDQIKAKTFDTIKLVESLVVRDKAQKFLNAEKMRINLTTQVGPKTKKVAPYNLWINILNEDGVAVYACTYQDYATGNSIIIDGDGKEVASGKGWKKVRDYFRTEVETPKAETSKKTKTEKPKKEPKAKKAKKVAPKKDKHDDPPAEEKKNDTSEQVATEQVVAEKVSLDDFIEPEIPEELVG